MAKVLKSHDWNRGRNRKTKYPWAEWSDGQIRFITKGKDYDCKTSSIQLAARSYARSQQMKARTEISSDPEGLFFQFYKE